MTTEADQPTSETAWGGFIRGVRTVRLSVLVAAAVLAALVLGALELGVRAGAWTVAPEARVMLAGELLQNDYTHVAWQAQKAEPQGRALFILGGSSFRELFLNGAELEAAIADEGVEAQPFVLASSGQSMAESLLLLDNLPPAPGVLVLGLSHWRFWEKPEDQALVARGERLLLASERLRDELARQGRPVAWTPLLPSAAALFSRYCKVHAAQLRSLELPELVYAPSVYDPLPILSDEEKRAKVDLWFRKHDEELKANVASNFAILEATIELAHSRNLVVLLVQQSDNLDMVGAELDRFRAPYLPRCLELVKETPNLFYVDFNTDIPAKNSDFHDLTHVIRPEVRTKWSKRLVKEALRVGLAGGA